MRSPVEVALEYFNCQNRRDLDGIAALLSPDFRAHTPWGPKSREAALVGWGEWMHALPPSSMTVRNVQEAGPSTVLIEIVMHFRPEPGDDRGPLDFEACDVINIVDGQILGLRAYFDRGLFDDYRAKGLR